MTVKGRKFDVQVDPIEMLDHLNWSTLPAWMSYAEARNGPIGLFNDIVYANITGSGGFAKPLPGPLPPLAGGVSVDYEQAIVEFGGTYEVWSGPSPGLTGSAALDLLAGGRYWHQDVSASGFLSLGSPTRETERSGSVDWVDPFVGARLRQQLAPGESLMLRADVGGFGVGSDAPGRCSPPITGRCAPWKATSSTDISAIALCRSTSRRAQATRSTNSMS